MKTNLYTAALIILMAVFASFNAFASGSIDYNNEDYIDDIPFDTEIVVYEMNIPDFDFADEAYIDDIPFDTELVNEAYTHSIAISVEYQLTDEKYIDDIPFDTQTIAKNHSKNSRVKQK